MIFCTLESDIHTEHLCTLGVEDPTVLTAHCALNEQSMAYLENSLNIKISLISGWRLAAPMAGGGEDGVGGEVDS